MAEPAEVPGLCLLDLPDGDLLAIAMLLDNAEDRVRFCTVNRRLSHLADSFEQLWETVEAAPIHMFRAYSMAERWLPKRRGVIRRFTLAPVMRGRPMVQSAEMEDLTCTVLEGLEGGALQQLSIVSLVQTAPRRGFMDGGATPLLPGECFKLPQLQELRLEGACRVDFEFSHLTALTSLHLGPGAHPALHYHSYASDGHLPASLARLHIADDGESYTRRSAIPASVRQLGGALRQLYIGGEQLAALPLRHLQQLSGLTSLAFVDSNHYACLGMEADSGSDSDSEYGGGSDSDGGDGHGRQAAGQAAGRAAAGTSAAAAAASVPAGGLPLLPELRELGLACAKWLPPAFTALSALSYLQLQGMHGEEDFVPDLVWQLPSLQVLSLSSMLLSPALAQHAPQLGLEQLCMDVPTAAQVPAAALAALPSLRCLELILPHQRLGSAAAHMADALLPVLLAPPALTQLLLHCKDLAELLQGSQGWASLLERLAQERPSVAVRCTGPRCPGKFWQCDGCSWRELEEAMERQRGEGRAAGVAAPPSRPPPEFDHF